MYKKSILIMLTLCISAIVSAQFPGGPPQGKVEEKTMTSKILDTERNYTVYLPKSYTVDTKRRYPILYLLHGLWGTNKDWAERGHLQDVANQIIDAREAVEMIIVLPDAGTGYNGYFNMEGWPYETYFFEEFIPYIESTYRVDKGKKYRAIAGLSMGGGGTAVYAQKYPDMFYSAYAMSALMTLGEGGGLPEDDPKMAELNRTVRENDAVKFVAEADEATVEKMRSINWYIDCGDDDFLLDANIAFVQAMQDKRIPVQFRVRDGGHTWEYWHSALYDLLPFVSFGFTE